MATRKTDSIQNEADVKCNNYAKHGLVKENYHNTDPMFEPTHSLTEPHLMPLTHLRDFICDLNLSKKINVNFCLIT